MIAFQWTDPAFSERLCFTLLHSLWQVTVLGLLAGSINRTLFRKSAEHSYRVYLMALFASLLAMPVTYANIRVSETRMANQQPVTSSSAVPDVAYIQPETNHGGNLQSIANLDQTESTVSVPSVPAVEMQPVTPSVLLQPTAVATRVAMRPWVKLTPWIAAIYLAGAVVMIFRLLLSIGMAQRLKSKCQLITDNRLVDIIEGLRHRFAMKFAPALMQAEQAIVPQVIGLMRPVILLPTSALTGLTTDELELILVHELAHVRRYDMWAALIQRLAEAVLFFNPALWFLSRRISELREFCCDDVACQTGGLSDRRTSIQYAQTLLKIVDFSHLRPAIRPQLSSLAASGRSPSELRRRVARLLGEPLREPLRVSPGSMLICASMLLGLLVGPSLISGQDAAAPKTVATPPKEPSSDQATHTFRLTVTGPDGKAIPNASCEVREVGPITQEQVLEGTFVKAGKYGTFAKASDTGHLRLTLPQNLKRLHISIKQPGFGPYWAAWDTARGSARVPNEAHVELEKAWSVGGVIVDDNGLPITGARVSPSIEFRKLPGDTRQLGTGEQIQTDAAGKWSYDCVPVSEDYVHISIDHPNHQPLRLPLPREKYELQTGSTPTQRIVLSSGLKITGTIINEQGLPIPNALVRTKFSNEIREARTDQNGHYTLHGCEQRSARVVATAPGRAIELQELRIDTDTKPVNFTLKPGGHVKIRVLDEQGKGLPKTRIFFQRWRGHIDYFEFDGVARYTDDNGVWEWNEAPLDEFAADICRDKGMQLTAQPLRAREEEYVFHPPQELVVSGKVIDRETKLPVLKYRAVPGTVGASGLTGDFWHQKQAFETTNGEYRIAQNRDAKAHRVRIEAVGYKTATSRDLKSDEGAVIIDFELTPAKIIAPQIVTSAGEPASGTLIALGMKGDQISIKNGEISHISTYATRFTGDPTGRFSMPEPNEPFQLIMTHAAGFASHSSKDGPVPETITLTPWARVEGTFRVGPEAPTGISLEIHESGPARLESGSDQFHISTQNSIRTVADGHFLFQRVFPGMNRVGRAITYMVRDGATEATSSQQVRVECVAGKTTFVNLGGSGRPVIGKLLPPAGHLQPIPWRFARIDVEPDIASPQPQPPDDVGNDAKKYDAWFQKWVTTPEGKTWLAASQLAEAEKDRYPQISASADHDGTFRIDDMPAGKFIISIWGQSELSGNLLPRKFSVSAVTDTEPAGPVQLGELPIEIPEVTGQRSINVP